MRFQTLNPVAERIGYVESGVSGQWFIVDGPIAGGVAFGSQSRKVADDECRMCLAGGPECDVNAKVDLQAALAKPNASAPRQVLRLCLFRQAQNALVEGAGILFFASRHGELNMIKTIYIEHFVH